MKSTIDRLRPHERRKQRKLKDQQEKKGRQYPPSFTFRKIWDKDGIAARKRWLHENNILKEKHQGYRYEHIFSHDWDAMRGYHYIMHIARMLNEMALHSIYLTEHVKAVGVQAFIKKFQIAMTHRELNTERLSKVSESASQLRLVHVENWKTSWFAA